MTAASPLDWLSALFAPRSIAVVGASDNPIKLSGRPIAYLKRFGYDGAVYPVNPSRRTVQGLRAYSDLQEIGEVPDLVLLMVNAAKSPQAVRECGKLGVPAAIVSAAGFAEVGPGGAALHEELRAAIDESGIRVLGPNCLGLIGSRARCMATFTSALDEGDSVPVGTTALVSQSGAFGTFIYSAARNAGVQFSHYANTGNEVDLDVVDLLTALCDDPEVATLSGYFEGLRSGRRLVELGHKAAAMDKPVIVAKAGRTESGARAVSSHTASLVGADKVFKDACAQAGIITVESINDIVDMTVIFDRGRRARGNRLSILTLSGGAAALMTDVATTNGVAVDVWAPAWQERMRQKIPAYGSAANPIDLTAELIGDPEILRGSLEVAIEHDGTDIVTVLVGNASHGAEELVDIITRASASTTKPVVVVWTGNNRNPLDALAAAGVAAYDDPARAARAIGALVAYGARQHAGRDRTGAATVTSVELPRETESTLVAARSLGSAQLDELASGRVLRTLGVPVVEGVQVDGAEQAWQAAQRLGLPCVVKLLSHEITHKSDIGGVVVGLADRAGVEDAYAQMATRSGRLGLTDARVMVQAMAPGGTDVVELIVGAHPDPSFGHVVTVGLGGVLVEVLGDTVTLVPPVDEATARDAIGRLHGAALLGDFRGRSPRDLGAAAELVALFSRAVQALSGEVEDIELNPVLVGPVGTGAIAVDAVVAVRRPGGHERNVESRATPQKEARR